LHRLALPGLAIAAALTVAAPARPAELVAGFGADGLRGNPHFGAGLEARTDPLLSRGWFGVALGAAFEVDNDFWAGAGPVAYAALGPRWRLEASVMLGSYVEGDGGDDLGADFPIFRSQAGVSYALADGWRIGAAVGHKSNARTSDYNPGIETVFVTVARRF
jgi:hypothetical protein